MSNTVKILPDRTPKHTFDGVPFGTLVSAPRLSADVCMKVRDYTGSRVAVNLRTGDVFKVGEDHAVEIVIAVTVETR